MENLMSKHMNEEANNEDCARIVSYQTSTVGKLDLKSTKTELFNKLMGSQSQQTMIVTTPNNNNKNGDENLNRTNSIAMSKETQFTDQQATIGLSSDSLAKCSNLQTSGDLKREPVVFSRIRNRWYTNEEVSSILTNFSSHPEWQTNELQIRPKSGAVLLYSREKVRYRQDGYCWKKRKNGRTTREDHMKLKVQGIECIYGCYVHSAILPTFHRRGYWLLENPDIVLVHYLNQPPDDQNKMMITLNPSSLEADTRRSWTNEEIIEEIGSVFGGISQIQQTLNINFPPSTAIVQQPQLNDPDRMIESSPRSEQSQATTNSDALNGTTNIDTKLVSNGENIASQQYVTGTQVVCNEINNQNQQEQQDAEDLEKEDSDELMSHTDQGCEEILQPRQACVNESSCDAPLSGDQRLDQSEPLDESISMTFEIVNHCDNSDTGNNTQVNPEGQPQTQPSCFRFQASVNPTNSLISRITNNNNNNNHDSINQPPQEGRTSRLLEQNLCSPVTQIYNKIVDDIETYALPLEPNQFETSHHHHHHHHHHSLSMSSLPVSSMMDIGQLDRAGLVQQQQQTSGSMHGQQHMNRIGHNYSSRSPDTNKINNNSDCSMDLSTCDLFDNGSTIQVCTSDSQSRVRDLDVKDDSLLLTEFNLPSGVEVPNINDSLSASDDLRDLMMGINSNDNQTNLLVDSNSLDLFDFKPPDASDPSQHLDIKSSMSDTDTMNRLSPLINPVPRCNSTGASIQLLSLNQQPQHLSNQYLRNNNAQDTSHFSEFHTRLAQRSSSTNVSTSTSCSPSPSSFSLRAGFSNDSSHSVCVESNGNPYNVGPSISSSHSFIKLPLQHRQKSEQQEPSNSVLNSLLPKALSLDGYDHLSVSNQQQVNNDNRLISAGSPLIDYGSARVQYQHQQQQNLLLIPQTALQSSLSPGMITHNQTANQKHIRASLSPSIPLDNRNDSLQNNSSNNNQYQGSPNCSTMIRHQVYNSSHHQLSTTNLMIATTQNLLPIVDYVPNWSNITGGAKVLIVGEWKTILSTFDKQQHSKSLDEREDTKDEFFALFDNQIVPASLIQDNVLRCYAPSHEPGFITLKVLFGDRIISEQVLFEMRPSCMQTGTKPISTSTRGNQSGGQDPSADQNNNNNNSTQQTNSNSGNQSITQTNQKQISTQSNSSSDNSKVLTLAENIISAMHKKINSRVMENNYLENDFNIEHPQHYRQRHHSLKISQRPLAGSRSLSHDSESSFGYSFNQRFNRLNTELDPYWHHPKLEANECMQPLSVVTDFSGNYNSGHLNVNQKRHSSGGCSSTYSMGSNQIVQRPTLNLLHQSTREPASAEGQNYTETSSSGLGSIVSSLSPSTSSLHSPSSACVAVARELASEGHSPCSCSKSSGTPTSADFCEYFQASTKTEDSFAGLTLDSHEQQELYEAAKIIQKAYRIYRGRKRQASELLIEPSMDMIADRVDELQAEYQLNTGRQKLEFDCTSTTSQAHRKSIHLNCRGDVQSKQLQLSQPILVKCYRDREMQAATIIQAYYRRYRQYANYKRQRESMNNNKPLVEHNPRRSPGARLVVDTIPVVINKATTSNVDRKRLKTAVLISGINSGAASFRQSDN